ncbi:MAG: DUF3899 domain-containing protein [Oscillospiraceae bacterium]|nr:DUF3899 domain-containing protein [Oscillospiraceae bacterium]
MTENSNSKLKGFVYTLVSALLLCAVLAVIRGLLEASDISHVFMILSDSCFVCSVLYIGLGALVWISLSGIFDILGFGIKSLKYLFTPIKKDPAEGGYYEYVLEKREKRKGKTPPYLVLIIGLIILVLAVIFLVLWSVTGAYEAPAV